MSRHLNLKTQKSQSNSFGISNSIKSSGKSNGIWRKPLYDINIIYLLGLSNFIKEWDRDGDSRINGQEIIDALDINHDGSFSFLQLRIVK